MDCRAPFRIRVEMAGTGLRRATSWLLLAWALAAASGCATTDAVNNSSGSPGSACIKGSIPSLGAFYGAGNAASVQIREIDGAPVKPEGWRSHCVAAGNHQIGFLADSADQYRGFRVVDYVALELAPSSKYVLRGDFEGINLILHVLKVGGASPVLIQDLSFKISDRVEPTPVFVAVPIPAHH